MARKKGHWQSERCTVCSHPKIGIINFSLARGISPLSVAKQHGLGTSAVYNHNRAHVEENYRKIIGSGVYADIDELLKKCTQGDAESLDVLPRGSLTQVRSRRPGRGLNRRPDPR